MCLILNLSWLAMFEVFSFLSNQAVSFYVDIFCFVLYVLIPTLYSDPIVALCL